MKIGFRVRFDDTVSQGYFALEDGGKGTQSISCEIDGAHGLSVTLKSEMDAATTVTRRRLLVSNTSDRTITIYQADLLFELAYPCAHLDYFTSDWGSEYSPVSLDVTYPIRIGSLSGRSSKGCCPYFTLSSIDNRGQIGISVGWSGNWEAECKRLINANQIRVGLLEDEFSHCLKPGAVFENIELFDCVVDDVDREALAQKFRTYFRDNIRLMPSTLKALPATYNHWWPYEDKWINEDIFYENILAAEKLGCTNSLLDAGWFGPSEQVDVNASMPWYLKRGDWDQINTTLFPSGIEALGEKVNQTKVAFGIWCEIEAVGKDAQLNIDRPELIARRNGESLGGVCMGNPKTIEWALDIVSRLVEDYGAKWIKFDFNLDYGLGCDCEEHGHGKGDGLYAHYIGYYRFLDEIRKRWPDVIIENCSSGGLRIDYGLMQHCHLLYLSDPDYTRHHLQCFWGALSHIHPSVCYHFTWSDTVCDHNFRWDSKGNRYQVQNPFTADISKSELDYMVRACMPGVLGISHKLNELPDWIWNRLKTHIAFYHSISGDFTLRGDIYRLTGQTRSTEGIGETWNAYLSKADDNRALLFVFKSDALQQSKVICLTQLDERALYELRSHNDGVTWTETGYSLMNRGIEFFAEEKMWSDIIEINRIPSDR